jgi:hypothetical protein
MKTSAAAAAVTSQKASTTRATTTTASRGTRSDVATTTTQPAPRIRQGEEENNSRQAIFDVIAALQQAIRRPLYVELALQDQEQDICKSATISKEAASETAVAAAAEGVTAAVVTETASASIGSKKMQKRKTATVGQKQQRAVTPTAAPSAPVPPAKPSPRSWTVVCQSSRAMKHSSFTFLSLRKLTRSSFFSFSPFAPVFIYSFSCFSALGSRRAPAGALYTTGTW